MKPYNDAMETIQNSVLKLKEEKNAIILAHNYTLPEIQDIADFVGDSLGLSRKASETDADLIVFCGVSFMGETAKVLNPDKKVLLPIPEAGCAMASMCTGEQVRALRKKYPDAAFLAYVNTTADVKAEVDMCCTSSNVIDAVKSLKETDIVFVPDTNLAEYAASLVPEKNIIKFHGYCPAHHGITVWQMEDLKTMHPGADVISHPESPMDVLNMSDFIGSTEKMIGYVRESANNEFIVGTEIGMYHRLKKLRPDAEFYFPPSAICQTMKMTDLRTLYKSLSEETGEIILDRDIMDRARRPIEKMLTIG
jgi:quinolinate synthase